MFNIGIQTVTIDVSNKQLQIQNNFITILILAKHTNKYLEKT